MFNEKLFNDVKAVSFKNTIYEYDAPEVIAQLESVSVVSVLILKQLYPKLNMFLMVLWLKSTTKIIN